MSRPQNEHEVVDTEVDEAAAGWFARRRAGELSPAEAEALERWLDADPANRAALDALDRAWRRAELARDDPEILAWRERARARNAWWPPLAARAVAASLVIAVAGGGAWFAVDQGFPGGSGRFYDQTFETDLGQRATFTLRDGSEVTLNTNTKLRTEAAGDRRLVYLDKGQAFFSVAKDPARPFVVKAGGRTITALGTAFDVRVEPHRFEVTLVEGRVRVETPAPHRPDPSGASRTPASAVPVVQVTEMTPGAQLVADSAADWRVQQANTVKETSWLSGRLMFDNEPLGAVAAEFARYTDRRITFADPAVADVPITGTFRSGDVETFVQALERYRLARIVRETPEVVALASY